MNNQKRNKKVNDNSGITLIALAITIIILIILAGISIGAFTGENGLIKNAQRAKIETEIAQYIDRVELARGKVAIDNLGIVTLDNLIEQIYEDEIVPRGNITKQEETSAKMLTVEGYEFLITAEIIEYIGNSGPNGETIPPITEGTIQIGLATWNTDTHTASVNITKKEGVSETLEVQYQVNGYEEEGWITGTTVENLNHNDTVYARLWNGTIGGKDYISQEIKDIKAPDITINVINTSTNSITVSLETQDNEYGMPEIPNYIVTIKKTNEESEEQEQTGTQTSYQLGGLTQATSYIIKVETTDKAGNTGIQTKEVTTGTVAIATGNITISGAIWNPSTHRASVSMTKGDNVASNLEIQYQINGYGEGGWTTGNVVSNLSHNDTVYARLWDGVNGGDYTSQDIKDGEAPDIRINITNTTTNSIKASIIAQDNQYGMPEVPSYTVAIKRTNEGENAWKEQTATYTEYNFGGLTQNTKYTIKITTKDKAGNTGTQTKEVTTSSVATATGNITISGTTWNQNTHTASVSITKGSGVGNNLEIQYQVNGYQEGRWTTGSIVSNLNHNDIVYARLWDGVNGGNYTTQTIKDGTMPRVLSYSRFSPSSVKVGEDIVFEVIIADGESGVDTENSRWTLTTSESKIGTNPNSYTGNFYTGEAQYITTRQNQKGIYYLHVLIQDRAGNKIEDVIGVVAEVTQPVTGVSLNRTSMIMEVGQEERLIVNVEPTNADIEHIEWYTEDSYIAGAYKLYNGGAYNGIVIANSPGIVNVCVRIISHGREIVTKCNVIVATPIQELKAGDYIKYDTGVSTVGENGVIMCRVLYPIDSEYGLQIISQQNVEEVTLGKDSEYAEYDLDMGSYTMVLNKRVENYVNIEYAYDARCVGSKPTLESGMFIDKNNKNIQEKNERYSNKKGR